MLFNSLAFAIFMPIVFILYWAIPQKYRWIVLLIASYYSYMSWNPKYVLLILLTTAVSYICGIYVEKIESAKGKKWCIVIALVVSLGVLFFFKYFNFFSESVCSILQSIAIPMHPVTLKVILPVGISFYTFQSLSYVLDVYRGEVTPQRNFFKYALFISFFPQLVAGPIERTQNLMPQLFEDRKFDPDKASEGLRLMLVGFVKKLVIADALSRYVDLVFDNVHYYFGMTFIFAAILFTFQIYCDFSGYSDIAIGTAKLLNVDLMTNFKSPYFATSIKDFWSRWHISLSTWFRDYVYIPLGGSRVSKARHQFNLIFTMLVSGLWHGADWSFVVWGGLHGIYQAVEGAAVKRLNKNKKPEEEGKTVSAGKARLIAVVKTVWTFALVSFAWIFFRANNMSDALYVVTHLHNGMLHLGNAFWKTMIDLQLNYTTLFKIVAAIAVLMVYDYFNRERDLCHEFSRVKMPVRWLVYIVLVVTLVTLKLHGGTTQNFIYFQF